MELLLLVLGLSMTYVEGQMYDRLYADLMKNDYSATLPMPSADHPVVVKIGMSLIKVKSINTETGDADFLMWLTYSWNDGRLTWSKKEYNDIDKINVDPTKIWTPDIEIYDGDMKTRPNLAILKKSGDVLYVPRTDVSVRCYMSNYTHDNTVICSAMFGSWTYDGFKIDLQLESETVGLEDFKTDRWVVESTSLVRNVKRYSCCPEPYPDVTVTMVFRDLKDLFF